MPPSAGCCRCRRATAQAPPRPLARPCSPPRARRRRCRSRRSRAGHRHGAGDAGGRRPRAGDHDRRPLGRPGRDGGALGGAGRAACNGVSRSPSHRTKRPGSRASLVALALRTPARRHRRRRGRSRWRSSGDPSAVDRLPAQSPTSRAAPPGTARRGVPAVRLPEPRRATPSSRSAVRRDPLIVVDNLVDLDRHLVDPLTPWSCCSRRRSTRRASSSRPPPRRPGVVTELNGLPASARSADQGAPPGAVSYLATVIFPAGALDPVARRRRDLVRRRRPGAADLLTSAAPTGWPPPTWSCGPARSSAPCWTAAATTSSVTTRRA